MRIRYLSDVLHDNTSDVVKINFRRENKFSRSVYRNDIFVE